MVSKITSLLAQRVVQSLTKSIAKALLAVLDDFLVRSRNPADLVFYEVGSLVLSHGFQSLLLHCPLELGWDTEDVDGDGYEGGDAGEGSEDGCGCRHIDEVEMVVV